MLKVIKSKLRVISLVIFLDLSKYNLQGVVACVFPQVRTRYVQVQTQSPRLHLCRNSTLRRQGMTFANLQIPSLTQAPLHPLPYAPIICSSVDVIPLISFFLRLCIFGPPPCALWSTRFPFFGQSSFQYLDIWWYFIIFYCFPERETVNTIKRDLKININLYTRMISISKSFRWCYTNRI